MVRQGYQPVKTDTNIERTPPSGGSGVTCLPPPPVTYVGIDLAYLYGEEDNRYQPNVMNIKYLSLQIDELREEIRRLHEKVFKLESK
jgi:hypothetical protein